MANKQKQPQTPNTLGYTNTSYKEKMTQMSEQEKIIEEKKRKILEKMKADELAAVTQHSASHSVTPPVARRPGFPSKKTKFGVAVTEPKKEPAKPPVSGPSTFFVNDGNFMERFKQMQGLALANKTQSSEKEDKKEPQQLPEIEQPNPAGDNNVVKEEQHLPQFLPQNQAPRPMLIVPQNPHQLPPMPRPAPPRPPGQLPNQPPPLMAQNVHPVNQQPRMSMPLRPLMQQVIEPPVSSPEPQLVQQIPLSEAFPQQPTSSSQPVPIITLPPGHRFPPPPQPPQPAVTVIPPGHVLPPPPGMPQIHAPISDGNPPISPSIVQVPPHLLPPGIRPHNAIIPGAPPPGPEGPPPLLGLPTRPPPPPPPSAFHGQPHFAPETFPPGTQPPGFPPRPMFTSPPPPPGAPPGAPPMIQNMPPTRFIPPPPHVIEQPKSGPEEYDPSEPTSPTVERNSRFGHSKRNSNGSMYRDESQENFDEYGNPIEEEPEEMYDDYGNLIKKEPIEFDDYGNPIKKEELDDYGNPVDEDEYDPSVPTEENSPDKTLSFHVKKEKGVKEETDRYKPTTSNIFDSMEGGQPSTEVRPKELSILIGRF